VAIDTAAKRKSVAHIARFWSGAGVTPDATPDQAWRQAVGRSYIGILAGGFVEEIIQAVDSFIPIHMIQMRGRR
jgi:hypothetical protein